METTSSAIQTLSHALTGKQYLTAALTTYDYGGKIHVQIRGNFPNQNRKYGLAFNVMPTENGIVEKLTRAIDTNAVTVAESEALTHKHYALAQLRCKNGLLHFQVPFVEGRKGEGNREYGLAFDAPANEWFTAIQDARPNDDAFADSQEDSESVTEDDKQEELRKAVAHLSARVTDVLRKVEASLDEANSKVETLDKLADEIRSLGNELEDLDI